MSEPCPEFAPTAPPSAHPEIHFRVVPFSLLSTLDLYELLRLRAEVFVVEQNCVYQDLDGIDPNATHVLGRLNGELVAVCRWFAHPRGMALGRIVTKGSVRRLGVGRALMNEAMKWLAGATVVMHAQAYLRDFYASYGFVVEGEGFLEDGIPHVLMVRRPTAR